MAPSLPPSLPAPPSSWRRWVAPLTWIVNDTVMGLLAIIALGTALMPVLFDLSERREATIRVLEFGLLAAFVVDYLINGLLAVDRWAYVRNPWRLFDLMVLLIAGLSLLPAVSDHFRHALALRLLRVVRALSFGMLAGSGFLRWPRPTPVVVEALAPEAFMVRCEPGWPTHQVPWAELMTQVRTGRDKWIDVRDADASLLVELAQAAELPSVLITAGSSAHTYPRLRTVEGKVFSSLWLPLIDPGPTPQIRRVPVVLMLGRSGSLLTAAPSEARLLNRMIAGRSDIESVSLPVFALEAFFRTVLEQNEEALAVLENSLRGMEEVPVGRFGEDFFRLAAHIRQQLSQLAADLWRISGILDAIETHRVRLPVTDESLQETLTLFSDQADYLYETANNLRETVTSLIELHLNTVSFMMNRFMKLLAVVSVLGLVPATVGGLLGMNVIDAPWSITLAEVVFFVTLGMLAIIYVFLTSGNLK